MDLLVTPLGQEPDLIRDLFLLKFTVRIHLLIGVLVCTFLPLQLTPLNRLLLSLGQIIHVLVYLSLNSALFFFIMVRHFSELLL